MGQQQTFALFRQRRGPFKEPALHSVEKAASALSRRQLR